ncbi:MAG: hypothetical protein KDH96_12235, partial [Candidatus Riesia sp.]|nr:hypothetical protein [Candidatus Riesia sp.]
MNSNKLDFDKFKDDEFIDKNAGSVLDYIVFSDKIDKDNNIIKYVGKGRPAFREYVNYARNLICSDAIKDYFTSDSYSRYICSETPNYITFKLNSEKDIKSDIGVDEFLFDQQMQKTRRINDYIKFDNNVDSKLKDAQNGYAVIIADSKVTENTELKVTQELVLYMFDAMERDFNSHLIDKKFKETFASFMMRAFNIPNINPTLVTKTQNLKKQKNKKIQTKITEACNTFSSAFSTFYNNDGSKDVVNRKRGMLCNFAPFATGFEKFRIEHKDELNTLIAFTHNPHNFVGSVVSAHIPKDTKKHSLEKAFNLASKSMEYYKNKNIPSFVVRIGDVFTLKKDCNLINDIVISKSKKSKLTEEDAKQIEHLMFCKAVGEDNLPEADFKFDKRNGADMARQANNSEIFNKHLT